MRGIPSNNVTSESSASLEAEVVGDLILKYYGIHKGIVIDTHTSNLFYIQMYLTLTHTVMD